MTDVHGAAKALDEVLIKANFDFDNDQLIIGGDLCDGYPQTYEVLEIISKIKNKILLRGNHDTPFINFLNKGYVAKYWEKMGAYSTIQSYDNKSQEDKQKHLSILKQSKKYHKIDDMLFVHAGFNLNRPLDKQSFKDLNTNHSFWEKVLHSRKKKFNPINEEYKLIFIGHTPTNKKSRNAIPIRKSNVINCDTGAGNGGRLTLVNIKTLELIQSQYCNKLYN